SGEIFGAPGSPIIAALKPANAPVPAAARRGTGPPAWSRPPASPSVSIPVSPGERAAGATSRFRPLDLRPGAAAGAGYLLASGGTLPAPLNPGPGPFRGRGQNRSGP